MVDCSIARSSLRYPDSQLGFLLCLFGETCCDTGSPDHRLAGGCHWVDAHRSTRFLKEVIWFRFTLLPARYITYEYPEYIARFYDVIYGQLRTVDRHYFLRKIKAVDGPVLEIGVGTGRFFIEALSNGADIYGIDVSPTMLDQLYQKLDKDQHHRVVLQDARSLNLQRQFELVVAPFRVFSHITSTQDQLNVLNHVYDHLRPGGQLIFDLYVPDLSILVNGISDQVDFDGEYAPGKRLTRTVSAQSDLINQVTNVTMTLQWDDDGGRKVE